MSKTTEERRVCETFWKGPSLAFKRIKGKERVVLWNLQNWCYLFKIVQTRSTTMNTSSIFIVRLHYHNRSSISQSFTLFHLLSRKWSSFWNASHALSFCNVRYILHFSCLVYSSSSYVSESFPRTIIEGHKETLVLCVHLIVIQTSYGSFRQQER